MHGEQHRSGGLGRDAQSPPIPNAFAHSAWIFAGPAGAWFLYGHLRDPELAWHAGLISAKAQITIGTADWTTYLKFLALARAMGGIILFGLIVRWVFGREYSDRTVKDLLALPTSRSAIVFANSVVVAVWSAALIVVICFLGPAVGAAVGLLQVAIEVFLRGGVTVAVAALLTIALVTPIAFFASAGHGYLPPIGIMILAMGLAQVIGVAGWGGILSVGNTRFVFTRRKSWSGQLGDCNSNVHRRKRRYIHLGGVGRPDTLDALRGRMSIPVARMGTEQEARALLEALAFHFQWIGDMRLDVDFAA